MNTSALKVLCWTYCVCGSVGGAVVGFLSLGLVGCLIGLIGGLLISFVIQKGSS